MIVLLHSTRVMIRILKMGSILNYVLSYRIHQNKISSKSSDTKTDTYHQKF